MEAGITRSGRVGLALITVAALIFAMLAISSWDPALAEHIPPTGTVPANCVEFQSGTTGPKSPSQVPFTDVVITLDSWTDTPGDPHTVNFTISGLAAGEYVDISVKSGNDVAEDGPYLNGSHTFDNDDQQGISHIRLCVFVEDTTTTTVEDTTTTTVEDTTTTVQVLETTITAGDTTTSSIEDEVLDEEILPFTGSESGPLAIAASILALLGSLLVWSARRAES